MPKEENIELVIPEQFKELFQPSRQWRHLIYKGGRSSGKSQRICVPFKTEPDMARIREQLENYPASVFLAPVMEAE